MENTSFEDSVAQIGSEPENYSEIRNTHINIGIGDEISISELAKKIKTRVDFQGDLYFNSEKPDGMMRKLTDPSKLKRLVKL
ncbi:hypothetical protein [Christiangramia antarctica]|uniref:Uncharacterized protein n=2 Tax=Christiangramia TaxID=292691 RepID=A0ABW5X8P4_9FLAO